MARTDQSTLPELQRLETCFGDKSLVQVSECNWHRSSTVVRLRRRSIGEDLSSFRFAYFARFAASLWASDGLEKSTLLGQWSELHAHELESFGAINENPFARLLNPQRRIECRGGDVPDICSD